MKRFKKALTAIMAAAMVISATGASLTAFATEVTESTDPKTATTTVSYGANGENDPTYTVTIPAAVSFGEDLSDQTDTVTVEDVYLGAGKAVEVTVESPTNYNMLLNGTDMENKIPYTLKAGDKVMTNEEKIVIVVPTGTKQYKEEGTAELVFHVVDRNIPRAGSYSDILTFTIDVIAT